jgi:hypothetical protein
MKAIERKSYFPTGMSSSLKFGGSGDGSGLAYYLQGNDRFSMKNRAEMNPTFSGGREIFFAGTGGEDIAKHIRDGGNFGRNKYGGGNPFLDKLGRIQAEGLNFTQGPDNMDFRQFSQSALGSPMAQRAAGMAYLNMQHNVSSGAGFSQASIAAGASVSETRGSTRWDVRNAQVLRNNRTSNARRDSFVNGVGGMMMNVVNRLSGGRMFTSSGHRSVTKDRRWNGIQGAVIIQKAQQMGIREFPEWMDMIKEIPEVDMESPDNMKQAWSALRAAESIASQYVSMRNAQMSSIGFGSSIKANANLIGFSGAGLYENIALLAATKRTNFNNTEVVEESKSKLSLTNSQIFSIRFNSTRGDRELQDRLRYVDQLEAMASGTSPL